MDERSIWKKEISFRRKAGNREVSTTETEGAEETSVWKKEISFKRKAKPAAPVAASEPDAPKQSIWKKEIALGRKPRAAAAQAPAPEPVVEPEPVAPPEPEAAPIAQEPVPVVEPVVPAESVERPVVEVTSPAQAAAALEPERQPVVAEAPTLEAPPTIAPEPVPAAPVVQETVPAAEPPQSPWKPDRPVPFWKREIVIGRRGPAKPKAQAASPGREQSKSAKTKRAEAPRVKADRGGKGKKLVGLKIGASQLAAARVANDGTAELLQVAREPLSPGLVVGGELRDPDALAIALREFFAKHKLPKRGVRLGIANNRIGVRTFEVAGVGDQKQMDNAIRFRAQEALPIPIDEAVLDYHVLGETTTEEGEVARRILLVVAYREQIDRYVEACKKAGIALVGIDLEAFALLRALQAPQQGAGDDPSAALVAVAIGHERSTFAVSDGRVCEFTRVLEWGGSAINVALARALDAAPSEVEGVKRTLSLTDDAVPEGLSAEQATKARDAVRRAIEGFARELVSSLQFYQNQPGSLGIGEIVLTGGTTHLRGLAAELERLIGVYVRVGDPLARIKVSKRVGEPEQVGSLAVAIGLGIDD